MNIAVSVGMTTSTIVPAIFWRALRQLYTLPALLVLSLHANAANQTEQITPLGADEIQNLALAYANEALTAQAGTDSRFELGRASMDRRLSLRRCSEDLDFELQRNPARAGRMLVKVRCNDQKPWAIFVPLQFQQWKTVVTATRPLLRNHTIGPEDIELREVALDRPGEQYLPQIKLALGQLTTRNIEAGKPLKNNILKAPKLVKRGDQVVIIASNGSVSVKMNGKAMADGRRNEQITVQNLSSKRLIKARVVDRGTVQTVM